MDYTQPQEISVINPIGQAFEKTKEILFKPFDIGKWFIIGFTAWLATLGDGGSFNGNFGGGGGDSGGSGNPNQAFNEVKEAVLEHLPIIIAVAAAVIFLSLVIGLFVTWLKSRGKFMFLHCVAQNVAEVKNPWRWYVHQGNSLMLFKIVLWLVGMVTSLIFVVPLVLLIIDLARTDFQGFGPHHLLAFAGLGFGFALLALVFGIITTLTNDFVVPVMYKYQCTVTDGWKYFGYILKTNKGRFTLFLLFLILVNIAIGALVFAVVLGTCCSAACLLVLPYIGTVAMLPILVWRRAYSALYLAQYGQSYNVFPPTPQPQQPYTRQDQHPQTPPTDDSQYPPGGDYKI